MTPAARTSGSVLVAVLWCLVLLAATVLSLLHTTRLEMRLVKNQGDLEQARYLALAGIEKAKALLYLEAGELRTSGQSFRSDLRNDPSAFRDIPLGRGLFRVLRPAESGEGPERVVHGVRDEEGRLNVNVAGAEELKKLPGMTSAIAAAILDWRDKDDKVTPEGAESEHYASLSPSYRIRNGPLETLRELLMVRGVSPQLLLGEDWNLNGLLDPEENDGARSSPPDNEDGLLDAGWSAYLTVDSRVENQSARGRRRINIKSASEESLAGVQGISSDLAKAIVAYRGARPFESLADLLEVVEVKKRPGSAQGGAPGRPLEESGQASPPRASRREPPPPPPPPPEGQPPQAPPGAETAAPPGAAPPGSSTAREEVSFGADKLVSESLFKEIADDLTTDEGPEQEGPVNVNTAPAGVLMTIGGISEELAQAIVSYRQTSGPFAGIAGLLDVPGMTREAFKKACPRLTARSSTFRIVAEGLIPSSGARKRLEVVVRRGRFEVETLYFREDA